MSIKEMRELGIGFVHSMEIASSSFGRQFRGPDPPIVVVARQWHCSCRELEPQVAVRLGWSLVNPGLHPMVLVLIPA